MSESTAEIPPELFARLAHPTVRLSGLINEAAAASFLSQVLPVLDFPGSIERQSEADQIVRRIADYRLIEIADLDIDLTVGIGQRTQISDMTIPANPDRRPLRHFAPPIRGGKPLVELQRVSSDISVRRLCYLQIAGLPKRRTPLGKRLNLRRGLGH